MINLDIITNLDNTSGVYIYGKERHTSSTNSFMTFLSEFGREYIWSFTIAVLFLFGKREGKITALLIFVSMIIIIPINTILKEIIDRERPLATVNESSASYPSGHASIVTAGALGSLLYYNSTWKKKTVSILLIIEAFLVCISRIYLEAHYVSDVIGGVLLGSFIVMATSFYANSIYAIYCRIYNKIKKLI
ncbi:MAG TPA: phosphatase PAP2 family protein [Candidatus Nitrosocosmicus sp.]|nr:phosphatase PAP2 family protein [Candidatus Nitrosocosmicus sp.]